MSATLQQSWATSAKKSAKDSKIYNLFHGGWVFFGKNVKISNMTYLRFSYNLSYLENIFKVNTFVQLVTPSPSFQIWNKLP